MVRDLTAVRELAATQAAQAGRLQVERRDNLQVGAPNAHANDLVSDVDMASEQLIVDGITAAWPDDALRAEEGDDRAGTSGWTWAIDPLDGTRNYISRTGPWSVCIALYHGEQARVAVVHDPVARETFSAVDGGGALLNGKPISRSPGPPLDRALIGVSVHPAPETKDRVGRLLRELLPLVGDIRRIPAALNLDLPGGRTAGRRGGAGHQAVGHRRGRAYRPVPARPIPTRRSGHGRHFCIGASLARIELQVVFGGLTRRFPTLSLAVRPDQLRLRSEAVTGGLVELPVTWWTAGGG